MRRAAAGCGCAALAVPLFAALLFTDVDGTGYAVDFCVSFAAGVASLLAVGALWHVWGRDDDAA
jgi:hypothetical protein